MSDPRPRHPRYRSWMDPYSSVLPPYHRPPPAHLSRETAPSAYPLFPAAPSRREPLSSAASSSYYRQQQPSIYGDRPYPADGRPSYLSVNPSSSRRRSRSPADRLDQTVARRSERDLTQASTYRRYEPEEQYLAYLPSTSRFAETYATDAAAGFLPHRAAHPSALDFERHHPYRSTSRPTSVHQQHGAPHSHTEHVDRFPTHQYPASTYHPSYDMPRATGAGSTTGSATTIASSRYVPPNSLPV